MAAAKTPSKLRSEYHSALRDASATQVAVQTMIAQFWTSPEPLLGFLKDLGARFGNPLADTNDVQIARMAFREFNRMVKEGSFPALRAAIEVFKVESEAKRNRKRNFLVENDMTKAYRENPDRLIYSSEAVEKISMARRAVAYPPLGKWVCETDSIRKLWHYHLRYDPQADKHLPRHEPVVIAESKLDRVIEENQSCIIRDSITNEIVLIVLRDIISDMDVLDWLDDIVGEATSTRRNIRVSRFAMLFIIMFFLLNVFRGTMKVF